MTYTRVYDALALLNASTPPPVANRIELNTPEDRVGYTPTTEELQLANNHMFYLMVDGKLDQEAIRRWKGLPEQTYVKSPFVPRYMTGSQLHSDDAVRLTDKPMNRAFSLDDELADRQAGRYEDDITRRWD